LADEECCGRVAHSPLALGLNELRLARTDHQTSKTLQRE
jgi:hypothetical protein